MNPYPVKIVSGVVEEGRTVLLLKRKNTSIFDGYWAFPVGHCEPLENEVDTLRREMFEEVGIQVIDSEFFTRLYDNESEVEHAVYKVLDWRGGIKNNEPELCEEVGWYDLDNLPSPLTPSTKKVLDYLK